MSHDTHNFKELKEHILPLSENKTDFNIARREWVLIGAYIDDDWDKCPCGKDIKELCYIKNKINGNETYVGNVCVENFIGIDTGTLFEGLKRIIKDNTANANEDVIWFAHENGYIFENELSFLLQTKRKRKLTAKQLAWKIKINKRIATATTVRK